MAQKAMEPALTADVVLLAEHNGALHVLLIRRSPDSDAYPGCWALPGGYVEPGERFEQAARRELMEETGIIAPAELTEVGLYDALDRDPRGWVISRAYLGKLGTLAPPKAGDDAADAQWIAVRGRAANPNILAFDHHQILTDALTIYRTNTR